MRIALVVPGGVDRGGEQRVVPALLWLIERLARRHNVAVVALHQEPKPSSWPLLGATIYNVGERARRLKAVHTLLRLHRSQPFDVFQAMWARGPGEIALAAARLVRRPFLVHLAGGELVWLRDVAFGARHPWDRALSRQVLRMADRVTAASTPMLTLARQAGAAPIQVTLGVDTNCWKPIPPRPRSPDRPARLIHVGSVAPVKDHTTLLRATAQLARDGWSFQLDCVGLGRLLPAMERLAGELDLGQRVTFHGFVSQRRLVPLVQAADLMVVTSRHEAGPVTLLEAAAVGVPTVGTAVGHLCDWAPESAIAVPIGDAGSLARAMETLLRDDRRRLAVAHRAQETALRENADWTCARFEELYAGVSQAVPSAPPVEGSAR